jgi:hypothetical protein
MSISEQMEDGEVCTICTMPFVEDYGYPLACEECGGDGVLFTNATDEVKIQNGWQPPANNEKRESE